MMEEKLDKILSCLEAILATQQEYLALLREQIARASQEGRERTAGADALLKNLLGSLPPHLKTMMQPIVEGKSGGVKP